MTTPLNLQAAAMSHVGRVRSNNQDSGYVGKQIFFVADGMGGHNGGDVASATLAHFLASRMDHTFADATEATDELNTTIQKANAKLLEMAHAHEELRGLGTTLSSLVLIENRLAVGHVGDSRIYRYRGGKLAQITQDHTFVQKLIDSGRCTEKEARTHPQRNIIMRVLGDVGSKLVIDNQILEAEPADIWLLCSDGLSGVLTRSILEKELSRHRDPETTAAALINLTLRHGAPDNVTAVVLDFSPGPSAEPTPKFVGAAKTIEPAWLRETKTDRILLTQSIDEKLALASKALTLEAGRHQRQMAEKFLTRFAPATENFLAEVLTQSQKRRRNRRLLTAAWIALILIFISAVAGIGLSWINHQYYLTVNQKLNQVLIYQGVQEKLGPVSLSKLVERVDLDLSKLSQPSLETLLKTVSVSSLSQARQVIEELKVITAQKSEP